MIKNILYFIIQNINYFIFFYPLAMSFVWSIGGLIFYFIYERKTRKINNFIDFQPPITILVPCYNEEKTIHNTLKKLINLNYPNYIVIFINDGSKDNTSEVISNFVENVSIFHFLDLKQNSGKANALNSALSYVNTKYVLVLDADTTVDKDALNWLIQPFKNNNSLGAVTSNVLIGNKDNYLSRFQAAEFTCIVGLIKRCQHILGKLFTISGCATMFSTSALREAGLFSPKTATEDVDITWKIQRKHYKVLFEPNALAYIQAPTSMSQYIKQRKRWATGGWHLLRHHWTIFNNYKLWNLWLVYIEFFLSCIWAFCFVGSILLVVLINIITLSFSSLITSSSWSAAVISFIFIFQAIISISINIRYDKDLIKYAFWICWYPLVFFMIGTFLVVFTMWKGLFTKSDSSGKWESPQRI